MTASELDSLKEKLETGEFANSRDVKKLLKYVKEEILTRRHQTVSIPTDEESNKENFDTAKIANSIIRAYKKINPSKWEYVIQNETFIKLAIQLINKMKKLITYQEYTPYNDHAGCDAQCTGLCASCTGTNTGGTGGSGGNGSWDGAYTGSSIVAVLNMNGPGGIYGIVGGDGLVHLVDGEGNPTGQTLPYTEDFKPVDDYGGDDNWNNPS